MNKFIISLLLCLASWVYAESDSSTVQSVDQAAEEEELIGGIGGTGLMDMERPELLERPEIELDDLRGVDLDEALDAGDPVDNMDPDDMETP